MSTEALGSDYFQRIFAKYDGQDFSDALSDSGFSSTSEVERRVISCDFSDSVDIPLVVSAWHALLHWLRYDDEPVLTCLVDPNTSLVFPVVSETTKTTQLNDLFQSVCDQIQLDKSKWVPFDNLQNTSIVDYVNRHAVCIGQLKNGSDIKPGIALVYTGSDWVLDCLSSFCSESYQQRLHAFLSELIVKLQEDSDEYLSQIVFESENTGNLPGFFVAGQSLPISGNLISRFYLKNKNRLEKVAIEDQEGTLTFKELDQLSSAWSQHLIESGVKKGQCIGLSYSRNRNMIVAQYSVLKIGAVFVPLDANLPESRLLSMVNDASIDTVLTEKKLEGPLEAKLALVKTICSDDIPLFLADNFSPCHEEIRLTDPAYVIFTSGSTGNPKGVKVTHQNLLNFVVHFERENYIREHDTVSQFAPFSFDASVAEIHATILNGASLLVLWRELIDSPEKVQSIFTEKQVTFSAFPPQYLQHLSPDNVPTLKTVLTAGSAPSYEIIKKWGPVVRYINAYGPTETTVLSTAWEAETIPSPEEPIVMGSPIVNTEVKVVNRFGQALPPEATGELLIAGAGVADGYLNRDELNAERFVTAKDKRWYRSGDLASFNAQMQLIFNGRVDDQVKLRGHRVEPGEIEASILKLDCVDQVAAVVHKQISGLQLAVFLQGRPQDEVIIRGQLKDVLPHWAMPNHVIWLDALPLTANGKKDYNKLKSQLSDLDQADNEAYVFEDELESKIADIWKDTLQRSSITPEDNFFHLGGDSLTALVVVSALKNLNYSLSSSELLANAKFSDFVKALRTKGKKIERNYDSLTGDAPITPIQGWFFNQNLKNLNHFCQTLVFESDSIIDAGRLNSAIHTLVQYHDMLRSSYHLEDGSSSSLLNWKQRIEQKSCLLPDILEINHLDDETLSAETEHALALLTQELRVCTAPLFRLALLHTETHSRVVWVIHHLVVDTISHSILINDLYRLYKSESASQETLPGKSLSYFDWSYQLSNYVQENKSQLLDFWNTQLVREQDTSIFNKLNQGAKNTSLASHYCRFSEAETRPLLDTAPQCYRQSSEELVLASLYLALSETFSLPEVGVDVEWHGRDEEFAGDQGLDRTVGWFTSVHPLYISTPKLISDESEESRLSNWLISLKEARAQVPNRGRDFYSLKYLCEDSDLVEAFDGYSTPEVLFNFSGVVQRSQSGWQTVPIAAIEMGEGNENPYLLSVETEIRNGELSVGFYISEELWPADIVDHLKQLFRVAYTRIIEHCSKERNGRWTPSDFPGIALSQEEADEVPQNVVKGFPLTDMQQTMLRHKETYQVWMHYEAPRAFVPEAFNTTISKWVAHNDCLRTFIKTWDSSTTAQFVLEHFSVNYAVITTDESSRLNKVDTVITEQRKQEIVLSDAPPFEVAIIDGGADVFSFVLSIHHIIHDGWTIELLMDSFFAFYCEALGESVSPPDQTPANLSQVVNEQYKIANDADWNRYWNSIAWSENVCSLPEKPVVKKTESQEIALYLGELDQTVTRNILERAIHLGVTPNSLMLSGFVLLLRYLGGGHQVRCGVIQSGRPETIANVDRITGCCVNTLPLVIDFDSSHTLSNIALDVNKKLMELRDSAAFPLSKIYQYAKPSLSGDMFDCLFNIESSAYSGVTDPNASMRLLGGYESTNYPFIFGLIEQQDQTELSSKHYGLRIGFDTRKYNRDLVVQWVKIYENILKTLAHSPEIKWCDSEPLTSTLKQDVARWNDTRVAYPESVLLSKHFEDIVEQYPEKTALAFKDQKLSYRELEKRTAHLARLLVSKGVGPETVVALVAERSQEMILGILAIIRAGGAYTPVDPKYPEHRIRHILSDVNCQLALFQTRTFEQVIPDDLKVEGLFIDELDQYPLAENVTLDSSTHTTRQLAYVMYTSGSTGKPKGVMIEQRSIVRLIKNSQDIKFDNDDVILITSAPGFDVTTFEMWAALLNGLTLAGIDEDTLLDPESLHQEICDKNVSFLWVVAPLFNQLVQEKPDLFSGVKRIMIGGDALSPYHINLARQHSPGLEFINGYGPTENTSFSTYHFLSEADSEIIPIGLPITNSTCFVVNSDGQLLPPGVKGELYVGGDGVARGYFKRDELTAERFVENTFFEHHQDKLYRTGDLVSWRDDGLIDFHGRIDFQIKIRGFRVELGEIETLILRQADIKQTIVLMKPVGAQDRLVAYVVPEKLSAMDDGAKQRFEHHLVQALAVEVPDYMVPDAIVLLERMPLNANGKIDRGKLPLPQVEQLNIAKLEAAANENESILLTVLQQVLDNTAIGVTDDFYAIGGDSILAIQVVSRAKKQGLLISTRQIFEGKTVRNIAEKMGGVETNTSAEQENTITQLPVTGEQRLLPIQLHFFEFKSGPKTVNHYNQAGWINLTEQNISHAQLADVLSALIQRHDVFRLKFKKTGSGWTAKYDANLLEHQEAIGALIETVDLSQADTADRDAKIKALADRAHTSLDLKKGKLCHWLVLRDSTQDTLLWVMHHNIVDGVSWRVLLEDFDRALTQVLSESESQMQLAEKSSSYQEWAAKLYDYAYSDEIESELGFWIKQVSNPSVALPFDSEELDVERESSTKHETVIFDEELTHKLLTQANQCYSTNINDLLLSALLLSLSEWCDAHNGQSIGVELEGHGRESLFEDIDLSSTVGWFTTLYPVSLKVVNNDLGKQILSVKEQRASVPNNGIGFGVLNYISEDENLLDAIEEHPLGTLVFNYLGQMDAGSGDSTVFSMRHAGTPVSPERQRRHALGFNGFVKSGQLQFDIDFSQNQFSQEKVAILAKRYKENLAKIIEHCTGHDPRGGGSDMQNYSLVTLAKSEQETLNQHSKNIEDVYPATPMQQGLVLYTDRDHSGAYITQLRIELEHVNAGSLRSTWKYLLERHSILRTAFVDLGKQTMLQVVDGKPGLEWQEINVEQTADESETEFNARLDALLEQDRTCMFAMERAPLMRLLLVNKIKISSSENTPDTQTSVLAWTHHHSLIDGWSMGVLIEEMVHVYEALNQGLRPELALTEPYKRYIEWLSEQNQNASEQYWANYLSGIDGPTQLSVYQDGEPEQTPVQLACIESLSKEATALLTALARRSGVTLSALIQTAWAVLLSKYSGDNQVVFGYTVSGRPAELDGVESMVGLFINSLPMRVKLAPEQSILSCVSQIQQDLIDAERHNFVSLSDIQRSCGFPLDQNLFDSLIVVENYPLDGSLINRGNAHSLRIIDVHGIERNDFALNLVIYPGEELSCKLVYNTGLYQESIAAPMLSHFCSLLYGISDDADLCLRDLDMLNAHEKQNALEAWNATKVTDLPLDTNLYSLFAKQVQQRQDAKAIVYGDESRSYNELLVRSATLGEHLKQAGVSAGDRVAISLPKHPELIETILAVLKCGAAYVPVALDCPTERLNFMVADAGIKLVVARSIDEARFVESGLTVIAIDKAAINRKIDVIAEGTQSPDGSAYIIYTSGTTGRPKGVVISHANVINFCAWCHKDEWIKAGSRTTQFAPFTFDASVGEIFASLLTGAEMHLLSEAQIQEPAEISRYLVEQNIGFAAFPPPYLQQMSPEGLTEHTTILTAGSAPALELVQEWGEKCRYINAYGPTETTVLSSCWHYNAKDLSKGKLPIGYPIANTQLYVVDQYGKLCPPGVVGEIVIGGEGVALGYLNRDELTKQHFIDSPWVEGKKVYCTGDLGARLDNGSIEFAGRRDHQVKIRGFRIELSEVEYHLRQHSGVDRAAVLVKGENAEKQLLAWLVPANDANTSEPIDYVKGVRTALKHALPEYMIPQGFMLIDDLPLTANGKIDAKALLASDIAPVSESKFVAPRTELETQIRDIWSQVLETGPQNLSVQANFF